MSSCDVILLPTDFSQDSDQAFELACSVARDQVASLVVVHVLSPETWPAHVPKAGPINEASPVVLDCRQQFKQLNARAADIPISFRIVSGHAVGAIIEVAHDEHADLIVIASHQHSRFHEQLHGSVAEGLLRQSHCPLMVLRQPTKRSVNPPSPQTNTPQKP